MKTRFNPGALDYWITGNHGYDHPWNSENPPIDCAHCEHDFIPLEYDPDSTALQICGDCADEGIFVCPWCGEIGDGSETETGTAQGIPVEIRGIIEYEIICGPCFSSYILETRADPLSFPDRSRALKLEALKLEGSHADF